MKRLLSILLMTAGLSCMSQTMESPAPEFIVKMADARLMDREEGRLAASLGTTKSIRDYGSLMMTDQQMLFDKITALAASKNITLPQAISEKKAKALQKLSTMTGKKFDRRFIKMIKIDHKRDVKQFTKATSFDDAATRNFAVEYLPMIQSHLEKAQALCKEN